MRLFFALDPDHLAGTPRQASSIRWDDLTEAKIAAIPLLNALHRDGPG